MTEFLIAFMGLALVVEAGLVFIVGRLQYRNGYREGVEYGKTCQPFELPPGPYVCPHMWEPWAKAKWTITHQGYARVQRRLCEQCHEEQERIV